MKRVLIIDLQAKSQFTHHLHYVREFGIYFEKFNVTSCYISKFSKIDVVGRSFRAKKKGWSLIYGPEFKQAPLYFLLMKFLVYLIIASPKFFKDTCYSLTLKICTYTLYKEVLNEIINANCEVFVLFPSTDLTSLYLIEKIMNKRFHSEIHIHARILGTENRGITKKSKLVSSYKSWPKSSLNFLTFGVETRAYKEYLIVNGFRPQDIFWSPIPFSRDSKFIGNNLNFKNYREHTITLGFLGMAKERKGFEDIPDLIKKLSNIKSFKFHLIIQETIFPWKGYELTKNKIIKSCQNHHLTFLPGSLTKEEIDEAITMCDILILPYKPDSYPIQGSGILYQSANLSKPILAKASLGFSEEIKHFSIGGLYDLRNSFEFELLRLLNSNLNKKLNDYAKYRNKKVRSIINLKHNSINNFYD